MRQFPIRSAVAFAGLLLAIAPTARSQSLAVTGGTIIDATGRAPIADGVVLMKDGRITAVGPAREIAIPAGTTRIDATGKYLIPGLMDANLHLYLNIDLESQIRYRRPW